MKTTTKLFLCLGLTLSIVSVFGEDPDKSIATKDKHAKLLSESLQGSLSFTHQKDSIQIQAKPNSSLPLEFIKDIGLEPSDGILAVGSSFSWPGCGFDRTSYTIKEITQEFVLIEYTRGIAKHDGYQDSGEIKISL